MPKKNPPSRASRQLLFVVLAFALGLAGLTSFIFTVMPGRGDAGSPAIGSFYTMVGSDGRAVSSSELSGRPYLVFFGYTHCPDFCPTTLLDISAVFKELGPDKKVAAILVTVDPERDTPDVLKAYLENFDPRIVGLTGDPLKTEAIAKAFRVYAKKVPSAKPGEYTVDHTGAVYLMDKRGKFVSAFNLQRPPSQAARDLEAYF
ncbi:MAG: SCO family protein [Beijerinckiaceae bacterium]|nr:SCO family protein [Beijerinckiaceae bacterium]